MSATDASLTKAQLLFGLDESELKYIASQTPGGLNNIQDAYPLSPFQEGVLFHRLIGNGRDPYQVVRLMMFPDKGLRDGYLRALQQIIDRHNILRTAFFWEQLSRPIQVVLRQASLNISEVYLDPQGDTPLVQLSRTFDASHYCLPISEPPLIRVAVAKDPGTNRWLVARITHHLVADNFSRELIDSEIRMLMLGRGDELPQAKPFREFIPHTSSDLNQPEHERFFHSLLEDINNPSMPFGLPDNPGDAAQTIQTTQMLSYPLTERLRIQARQLGVSLGRLCHVAWGIVLARATNSQDVVYGTVLRTAGRGAYVMGPAINTLPVRFKSSDVSIEECVRVMDRQIGDLVSHKHASLALAQRCGGVSPPARLFSALLNFRHDVRAYLPDADRVDDPLRDVRWGDEERTTYPITLMIEDISNSLRLTAQVTIPLSPTRICSYMQRALEQLARALADAPQTAVSQLDVMPPQERELLLQTWNQTDTPYPQHLCIHQLFEQQVERAPEAIALVFERFSLTYNELNARANRLAHHLIALGVHPDEPVAICLERSPAMVIGLLAILKAGGAYVPLDPAYPSERLTQILTDAAPRILLADTSARNALGRDHGLKDLIVLYLDHPITPWSELPKTNPDPNSLGLTSRHLAYIIYTSGSTGVPKGVMNEHHALVNRLLWMQATYDLQPHDVVLQKTPFSFDVSVWEFFWTLLSGARLLIACPQAHMDPTYLSALIIQHTVSTVHFVPSMLHAFVAHPQACECASLKRVICSGEALPATLAERLYASLPQATLHNLYGPTEAAIDVTAQFCSPADKLTGSVPIGRPIANTQIYLLDRQGEPVPLGAIGEIHIGGAGVARGYLNRPELTAQRFLPDPFNPHPGARMYRTGDLARYLPDGSLVFLGRNDEQMKIRGYRIEPGEIEACLSEHPAVREAVVIAREDVPGEKRLVAYLTRPPGSDLSSKQLVPTLRAHLSARLPEYMLPAAYVQLDVLPLTPNGKLDRKALPAPDDSSFARNAYERPQGQIERTLAEIWEQLLGIEHISRHDNFFALGGHSLLAVRLLSRLPRAFGIELPLAALFAHPTLCTLAGTIGNAHQTAAQTVPPIVPSKHAGLQPLSFAQQRMWFLAQLEGASRAYHIPYSWQLKGSLNVAALQRSLNTVFARHEALRSVFVSIDGQPHVEPLPPESGIPLVEHDLREVPDAQEQLNCLSAEEASAPFDLARGPLIRAHLIHLSDHEHLFLLTQHHIISDGWSIGILTRELSTLYSAFSRGQPDPLPPLTIQYSDYAVWQRKSLTSERLHVQSEYWRQTLSGAPAVLDLPTDRPRPPRQTFEGAYVRVHLDRELTAALKCLSQRHGSTLFMVILAAWAAVLARLSGQEDLVIGTPTASRNRPEIEPLIGLFVNTLAVRIDLSGESTVAELLSRIRECALAAQDHQDLPFEQVVEILQPTRRLDRTPVFQVMFAWQYTQVGTLDLPGLTLSPAVIPSDQAKFDLQLSLAEDGQGISGTLGYAAALFDAATIERQAGYLLSALGAMAADSHQPVAHLPLLAEKERELLLQTWNQTDTPYPQHLCIHQLFEQQVERAPEAIALVFERFSLTYNELNARANRLAHHLIALGVHPDEPVAICLERSPAMVIGLLAILKAGGAYVPLDPAYPSERLTQILTDAAPRILLADTSARNALGRDHGLKDLIVLYLDHPITPWSELPKTNPDPNSLGLTSRHLAYIIYTSGSTGVPKGVMNEHHALVNRLLWMQATYDLQPHDVVLQKTPFSFDVSVWEFFWTLLSGARLLIACPQAHMDPTYLSALIIQHTVSTVHFVPSMLHAFVAHPQACECASLKRVICSGEALPATLAERLYASLPQATLHNLYGPTEAAIDVTAQFCSPADKLTGSVPIGRPIANTQIYLLDRQGEPVPLGAIGEIHIGGAGVARGYLNRPELTAQRFLPDPFNPHPGARMYRTGDLARYLPDGSLVFLGRNDEQMKIRGYRIEPGEIEACLSEHPAVREAVVIAREDVPGEKRLVAYLTRPPGSDLSSKQLVPTLRAHLSARLPEYMLPAAYVQLDVLPLTPNGKLDRKALPAPDDSSFARNAYERPQGQIERTLAEIWEQLLGIEHISRHDNFFALGGHSLLAVRLLSRLPRAFGIELPLAALFAHSTIGSLAHAIVEAQRQSTAQLLPPITPCERTGELALSFSQQRMWFLAHLEGVSQSYHLPFALHLRGPLDVQTLRKSLNAIFARHEALRSVFVSLDGQPHVELLAPEHGIPCPEHDLQYLKDAQEHLERLCTEEATEPFDLAHGPLIRARLIRLRNQEHLFLLTQHHIVSDGWSMGILLRELSLLYRAFSQGQSDPLSPLPIQYPDYAAWQRQWLTGERLRAQAEYWRKTLTGAPTLLELPTDRPRPPQQSLNGAHIPVHIDAELTQALRHLSQQRGTTLFMTLLAAWAAVLARLCGQDDLIIGIPTANRNRPEVEPLLGLFVNTLALRIDLSGEPTVAELLSRVRQRALEAQDHKDLPFEQLVEILQPPRQLDRTPVFQAMFAWQNNEPGGLKLPGLAVTPAPTSFDRVKFDLELNLAEAGENITGLLGYATALFDEASIERHIGYLYNALHAMVRDAHQPVAHLPLLAEKERTLLIEEWNKTDTPYPEHLCIHELFEQQVKRGPEATALIFEQFSLSYRELNAQANRLAHYLLSLGVEPDDRIAICLERSPALIIGLLAILKAGGAYIPLDPAYPSERLTQILSDAAPQILLCDAPGRNALGESALEKLTVIDVESSAPLRAELPATNLDPSALGLTPRHLAYIIYTSGSSGSPKGVMVEHANTVNLLCWSCSAFTPTTTALTLFSTSINFDLSVYECFVPLARGGCITLINNVLGLIQTPQNVSLINTVPSAINSLLKANAISPSTHAINLAGEPLTITLIRKIFTSTQAQRISNLYGPSETTTYSSWTQMLRDGPVNETIGRPIANTKIYLLDAHGEPVPLGAVGEIYIGGAGVARGYLNRRELTAQRFLPDPFNPHPGARMYRTGDLARYLPDGNLVFLGRNDEQVKIRGYRIEPGEIETHLTAHPAVHEAVVVAREDSSGEKRLIAYLTAAPDTDLPPEQLVAALRAHLSARLPEYMVPAAFVQLDTLPLTPSGKLDRKALPAPDNSSFARNAYEPPQGHIEQTLAEIWEQLLGIEQISRHDNFFALGGHSLLAARLHSRLAVIGAAPSLATILSSPTLRTLASEIQSPLERRCSTDIPPPSQLGAAAQNFAIHTHTEPLTQLSRASFKQTSDWLYNALLRMQGHPSLNAQLVFDADRVDRSAISAALNMAIERYEILRTTLHVIDGTLNQKMHPAFSVGQVGLTDLSDANNPTEEFDRLKSVALQRTFDLSKLPMFSIEVVRLVLNDVVILTFHHSCMDHHFQSTLLKELLEFYRAIMNGHTPPALHPVMAPRDYARWEFRELSGENERRHFEYWMSLLTRIEVRRYSNFFADYNTECIASYRRSLELSPTKATLLPDSYIKSRLAGHVLRLVTEITPAASYVIPAGQELFLALKRLAMQLGVPFSALIISSVNLLLSKLTGLERVMIAVLTDVRTGTPWQDAGGCFINEVLYPAYCEQEALVGNIIKATAKHMADADTHKMYPFPMLLRRADLSVDALGTVYLNYVYDESGARINGIEPHHIDSDFAAMELNFSITQFSDGLLIKCQYMTRRFAASSIESIANYFLSVLEAIAKGRNTTVAEIPRHSRYPIRSGAPLDLVK